MSNVNSSTTLTIWCFTLTQDVIIYGWYYMGRGSRRNCVKGDIINRFRKDIISLRDSVCTARLMSLFPSSFRSPFLKVKIRYPVYQVEQTEGSWEEDPRVGVNFGDTNMYPSMPPCTRSTVLKAAEKAGTILAVQAFVAVLLIPLLQMCCVVHLNCCRPGSDINSWRLEGKHPEERIFLLFVFLLRWPSVVDKIMQGPILH